MRPLKHLILKLLIADIEQELLEIGDIAVVVIVLAGHREDSFKACRYIIDEVKLRVPIWKKKFIKMEILVGLRVQDKNLFTTVFL